MKRFLFLFFLFLILQLVFPHKARARVLFIDSFDDGEADNWDIDYLTPQKDDSRWDDSKWEVNTDGEYGITFHDHQMRTISSIGDPDWSNYIYGLLLDGKSGIDKNVVFRYVDKDNWYGFHMRSDGIRFGVMKDGVYFDNNGKLLSSFSFQNNKIYSLKIIIKDNLVSFYVDGQCLVDNLEISGNPILNGKIGLYASTGDFIYPTSVYFDNVIVCTIDDPYNCDYPEEYFHRKPVILVPGHGASINFKEMFLGISDPDGWQMVPGAHVYDNLLKALEENGYQKGRDLFVFYYNWLNPIEDSSQKLHDFVNQVVATSSADKVNLIGHSMGGLVSRGCLEAYGDQCPVENLITVGSPHRGVPEAYGAWAGGAIWKRGFINRVAFEIFLNLKKKLGETRRETVLRIAPSTQELLPNFAYFKNLNGNEIPFNKGNYPENNLLSNWHLLSDAKANPYIVYGINQSTLRWLKIDKELSWWDKVLDNWPYGKPIEREYLLDGDGTVSYLSAYPEASLSGKGFKMGHRDIIFQKEAVGAIMERLGLKPVDFSSFPEDAKNYLVFYLHSPAHLLIEDEENIAPEDIFKGEIDGRLKLIIIASPLLDHQYSIKVVGDENSENDSREYTLTVGQLDDNYSIWQDYQGEIMPDQEDTFTIKFNPQAQEEKLKDIQVSAGELPLNEVLKSLKTTVATESALLEQKLDNLEKLIEIDTEKSWQYVYQIRNLAALLYKRGEIKQSIEEVNRELDAIAVYLRSRAENSPRVLSVDEMELSLANAQDLLNIITSFSPLEVEKVEKRFSQPAAFDFPSKSRP